MQKLSLAVVIGGLTLMPLSANSQDIATAPNISPVTYTSHLVFMENDALRVPDSAMNTVRNAADAARSSSVRIEGRADYAEAVKQELIRQGAPVSAISVHPTTAQPLPKAGDGVTVTTDRGVMLKF